MIPDDMEESLFEYLERDEPPVQPAVFTVSSLTDEIKIVLEDLFQEIWVEGEISNFKVSPSGHAYFRLKDDKAVLDCVMWRTYLAGRKNMLRDGLMVKVLGNVSVYPPRGNYQLVVRLVQTAGKGALQERFERLKASLQAEGLFDESRKRSIPVLPKCIGVVTSPKGAAIRDFLRVISTRFPHFRVVIAPVRVQGLEAPEEIAEAVRNFNEWGEPDVLVVTRGGGSLEDLWAFNEEVVARAIHRSGIPVVSAVGHEVDFTISDFVSDLRLATPTAAGAHFAQNGSELLSEVQYLTQRCREQTLNQLKHLRRELRDCFESLLRSSPVSAVNVRRQRLDELLSHMVTLELRRIEGKRSALERETQKLIHAAQVALHKHRGGFATLMEKLAVLDPHAILQRGYSITYSEKTGKVVKNSAQVDAGEILKTRLKEGFIRSEALEPNIEEKER